VADEIELENFPTLVEVPASVDAASAAIVPALLSEEGLSVIMGKVSALDAFMNVMTKDCNFEELIRDLLVAIMNVVKSEAGSFLEVDQRNGTLFFRSVVGASSDRVLNFVIPIGQGVAGHVAESRQPMVVDNVVENKEHLNAIAKAVGFETRNLVALPVVIRGRIFGVLELLNRIGEANYSVNDVELLTYLSGMAAKAIEVRLMISWSQAQSGMPAQSGLSKRGEAA
jgi:putative methionine-R-sulfoxide reductase with GAF domain